MSILEQRRVRQLSLAARNAGAAAPAGGEGDAASSGRSFAFPWRDIATSKVLWAIFGGLLISLVAPDFARSLAGPDGFASAIFTTVGGLTTPLVCLVIGASLAGGIPRDAAIVKIVALRTLIGLGLGLVFGLILVPALGFSDWYTKAAIMLFILPAPFVIPIYYKRNAAFLGGVLTLSTVVSIVVIAVLSVLGIV